MQDEIIKGSGNSRFLKSVSDFLTRYPAYEDFAAALIEGTLPVDFNGKNSAGIAQDGTSLNKANLLSDTVASALRTWGGTTPSTVNDALAMLPKAAKIQTGSYVGTGTYGASNPCSLTFNFAPKAVLLIQYNSWMSSVWGLTYGGGNSWQRWGMFGDLLTTTYQNERGFSSQNGYGCYGKKSADGKTFYWYSNEESALKQANWQNYTYPWIAIG